MIANHLEWGDAKIPGAASLLRRDEGPEIFQGFLVGLKSKFRDDARPIAEVGVIGPADVVQIRNLIQCAVCVVHRKLGKPTRCLVSDRQPGNTRVDPSPLQVNQDGQCVSIGRTGVSHSVVDELCRNAGIEAPCVSHDRDSVALGHRHQLSPEFGELLPIGSRHGGRCRSTWQSAKHDPVGVAVFAPVFHKPLAGCAERPSHVDLNIRIPVGHLPAGTVALPRAPRGAGWVDQ